MVVTTPPTTVYDVLPYLVDRYMDELANMTVYVDTMENELQKELHNGRLFRNVSKLVCCASFQPNHTSFHPPALLLSPSFLCISALLMSCSTPLQFINATCNGHRKMLPQ